MKPITITDVRNARTVLEDKILALTLEFEKEFGTDSIGSIDIKRWNGSNNAYGEVSTIKIELVFNRLNQSSA